MAIPIIDFRILVMEFLYISKISRTFRSSSKITIFKILAKNIRGLRIDIPRYCIKHKTKLWHCPFKNIHLCYPSLSKFKWNIVNIHWNKLTKLLNIDGVKSLKQKFFYFWEILALRHQSAGLSRYRTSLSHEQHWSALSKHTCRNDL